MKEISKWERVKAAALGEQVDRVPVSFWQHHAVKEWSLRSLAELTLQQFNKYDLDFMLLEEQHMHPRNRHSLLRPPQLNLNSYIPAI